MSFLSSAVKLMKKGKAPSDSKIVAEESALRGEQPLDAEFSLRNYAKESFSVLIIKPLSGYMMKVIRIASFIITGLLAGIIIALLGIGIFLQFGSVENTIISSMIVDKFEKLLPDSDLSMKSAMLRWNSETNSVEIDMKKVRLDDLSIPRVLILPDYLESFKQQRLVAKTISITNPKINLDIADDFKNMSFNPNLEKGGTNKTLFEPISVLDNLKGLFDDKVVIKFINAAASITENGVNWDLKNVYYEHVLGEKFPKTFACSVILPGQKYASSISCNLCESSGKGKSYDVKIDAINPTAINNAFAQRNVPLDRRILLAIDGYNLPVFGSLKLNFNDENKFLGGSFDLVGSAGSIRLPLKNSLSLNLGKKIDNGGITGSFLEDYAKIDAINISYGNSGLQLTGIEVPLSSYKFLDVANINGTLSLTNIDVHEMESMLPENISKSVIPTFKSYLPGFRLELFKIDLQGPIVFGNRTNDGELLIGKGIFKIKDAKIPLGVHVVTNVNATGSIADDGFDIRLTSANFKNTKINSGVFFLSNKDNSWIGKVNADVAINDISSYVTDISQKLARLPLTKLNIKGNANLDMKLVRVEGDALLKKELPFRIVEGEGVLKSADNTKELRLSWGEKGLFVNGDVCDGKSKINFKIDENFSDNSGNGVFYFTSNSEFLNALVPDIANICSGDFKLKIDSTWQGKKEKYDVSMGLKDATLNIPMIGDLKLKGEEGNFTAQVLKKKGNFEFSQMNLETKGNKISGSMTVDREGNILRCALDEFDVNNCSAKINLLREDEHSILFSAVGDSLDISKAMPYLEQMDKNLTLSAYVDLKETMLSNAHKIRNAKGSFDLREGKIVGGACYAVIGDSTTLALSAKDIEGTNDSLLSLSVSNAGEFLKYFNVTDTIKGGVINFVSKSSKNTSSSLSGAFEMSDFIVKDNTQFTKLISLSSTSLLPTSENITAGFNFCVGSLVIADNQIKIENGRAVGPTIGISFEGNYDRLNDSLDLLGISLPMSSVLNGQNPNGALAADYHLAGSMAAPVLSVKPLRFVDMETLSTTFGSMFPKIVSSENINYGPAPSGEKIADPFSNGAFDKQASNANTVQKRSTDKKYGVKITRGLKK